MSTPFQIWLRKNNACQPALTWLGDRDPETAWRECPRADWLLWALAELEIDRKLLVTATCRIARKVLHLVPAGEDRPRIAIETTERWVRGEATIEEVLAARRNAAAYASAAAYAAAAAASAAAAAYAAGRHATASAAAYAAAAASAAAYAAAYAAYAASAAYKQMQRECADIVREVVPWETVKALFEAQS